MFAQLLFIAAFAIALSIADFDERGHSWRGGASGTYAAVRLREDLNTSIAIIERQDHLGGHVQTYTIPGTTTTVEYGVQTYLRAGGAEALFKRFDIDIQPFASRRLNGINVDIITGKTLTGYTGPSLNATNEAFKIWLSIVSKYEPIMEPGYWNFPAPSNIPAELLLPFGEFATKYEVEAAVPRIMAISNVGIGGIRDILTLYVVQAFGSTITRGVVESSIFTPVGSNSLLYQRALALLKDDTYLSATILETSRTSSGVRLLLSNKNGRYVIKAKRLLVTAPPTEGTQVNYLAPNVVPSNYLALRDYKYTLRFDSTGPAGLNLFRILLATTFDISHEEAKATIKENVQKLVTAGTVNSTGECAVEFKAFADHNSVLWRQTEKQLKEGFVQKLYALQGYRGTWWTGGLWSADYSANVWAYTDTVLPKLLRSI
ncbi:hypothetical protein P154DRAFT_553972 [Amniculicola lignicola CBS 123094]|uniref:FAD/NAD(P)-binding domain-containing protein n=1 Tax=Amniculicola lignicola CBS 123094 TaxID=1392246 RepID=A0A6A5WG91_9PLEO|nr:hypothetical protein P154DRAFT_553972 [Amniculicola lignicola CBS 123094]